MDFETQPAIEFTGKDPIWPGRKVLLQSRFRVLSVTVDESGQYVTRRNVLKWFGHRRLAEAPEWLRTMGRIPVDWPRPSLPDEIAAYRAVRDANPDAPGYVEPIGRDEAIARIRKALKARSGRAWSVTGGRGTAWGWITITAPPARRIKFEGMTDGDRAELAALLGMDRMWSDGVQVAASSDHYQEYVDRAEGRKPSVIGQQYWD